MASQEAPCPSSKAGLINGEATDGGGIYMDYLGGGESSLTVSRSTISGSSAIRDGGGIFGGGHPLTVLNSTISGNTAGEDGGGIHWAEHLTVVKFHDHRKFGKPWRRDSQRFHTFDRC